MRGNAAVYKKVMWNAYLNCRSNQLILSPLPIEPWLRVGKAFATGMARPRPPYFAVQIILQRASRARERAAILVNPDHHAGAIRRSSTSTP